jgi:exosortase A-associated hydrolase 2
LSDLLCNPFFISSAQGALFAVHHRPRLDAAIKGHLLMVPAFNEEMNRCRSMVTQQALAFARQGWGTLVIDLHGTGDSAGEFADARWAIWLDNLQAAWAWLQGQPGSQRVVWGLRLGCILAAQFQARQASAGVGLLLWQPVLDGKTHLTQFMRVKIAAQMDRPDLPKASTADMRAQLAAGATVEIAGYELHPELCAALDGARLADQALPVGTPMLWLENAPADATGPSPATQQLLARWPGPGTSPQLETFTGPAFWQVHERVLAPAAIEASTRWLQGWPA